jgi:hypothetical protein
MRFGVPSASPAHERRTSARERLGLAAPDWAAPSAKLLLPLCLLRVESRHWPNVWNGSKADIPLMSAMGGKRRLAAAIHGA